ncbi:MAG: RtcB family protein [Candidatus Sumerlaeia bacterium]|nr:RtcB family protein [Candidatus Sumerlaeia bacterium]
MEIRESALLLSIQWPGGPVFGAAVEWLRGELAAGASPEDALARLESLRADPSANRDARLAGMAALLAALRAPVLRGEAVPYRVWGAEQIDAAALEQMDAACRLPVAVRGAQMPDGHLGYGLPIGGVLATRGAVIPYAVGVDIACRMKLSIVGEPASRLGGWRDRLRKALVSETRFNAGAEFQASERRQHAVLDSPIWDRVPTEIRQLHGKASAQLGTSGSGNHFVEWGELRLERAELGLEPGAYLALLSHSGSRGFGATIADRFSRAAMDRSKLPKSHLRLAWLELGSDLGDQYWNSMELAGEYAAANHDCIHRHVLRAAGLDPVLQIENHHNFAWIEEHGGERVVVHRKGATPAGAGVLGVIPGSMGAPGFVVRGKGAPDSLDSAAHGAGRAMSRTAAKNSITRNAMKKWLEERGVELLSAGVDEAPQAYKPIEQVMAAQADLVEALASFHPRIVRMADDGTAED